MIFSYKKGTVLAIVFTNKGKTQSIWIEISSYGGSFGKFKNEANFYDLL